MKRTRIFLAARSLKRFARVFLTTQFSSDALRSRAAATTARLLLPPHASSNSRH